MDILISLTDACAVRVDDVQVALGFLRMMAGQITPSSWVDMVHALVADPHAVDSARAVVLACMGLEV